MEISLQGPTEEFQVLSFCTPGIEEDPLRSLAYFNLNSIRYCEIGNWLISNP